jgi:channel protein (hemolysin III family)
MTTSTVPPRQRRGPVTEPSTIQKIEEKVEATLSRLVGWDDLPAWRRDNAYIIRAYRPDSNSYRGSFASLGYLHNESVNIWSHLLGALLFLYTGLFFYQEVAPRYESANESDLLVFSCFFGGAVACLGMSATYHALSNHSPSVSRWGNKLDYSGIVLLIVGSYVPALYYGLFCHPKLITVYLACVSTPLRVSAKPRLTWLFRYVYLGLDVALYPGWSTSALQSGAHFGRQCSFASAFRGLYLWFTDSSCMAGSIWKTA